MMVVFSLSIVTRLARAQVFKLDVLEFDPEVFTDDLAARQDRNVFEHRLTTITEAGRFDRCDVDRAAQFVDHESCQCFAFDIFSDNQDRSCPTWRPAQEWEACLSSTKSSFR